MFRLALALLLGLTTTAIAQEIKYFYTRQQCEPVAQVMTTILQNYGEQALWTGEGLQFDYEGKPFTGGTMFLVNQTTGTWTLLTLYADGTACVTAVGTKFEPFSR